MKLKINRFKELADKTISLPQAIVSGANGAGKTSILEAFLYSKHVRATPSKLDVVHVEFSEEARFSWGNFPEHAFFPSIGNSNYWFFLRLYIVET